MAARHGAPGDGADEHAEPEREGDAEESDVHRDIRLRKGCGEGRRSDDSEHEDERARSLRGDGRQKRSDGWLSERVLSTTREY